MIGSRAQWLAIDEDLSPRAQILKNLFNKIDCQLNKMTLEYGISNNMHINLLYAIYTKLWSNKDCLNRNLSRTLAQDHSFGRPSISSSSQRPLYLILLGKTEFR